MGKAIEKLLNEDVKDSPIHDLAAIRRKVQDLLASGAISAGAELVRLNHATVAIAATLAKPTVGRMLVITQMDAGTAGHTVTLAAGTFDGTNDVATFNAAGESLVLYGISETRFLIVENLGAVAFS